MTSEDIKTKTLTYTWEPWLERPFGAFILSLMARGTRRATIKKYLGVNMEWRAFVFERGKWYGSHDVERAAARDVELSLKKSGTDIFDITRAVEKFYREKKKRIIQLNTAHTPVSARMREFVDIMTYVATCIWLAHGLDAWYTERLWQAVPKYMRGDVQKNIGDICFPSKKIAHTRLEDLIRAGVDLKKVQKEFAWLKVRDGFSEGFTIEELRDMKRSMQKQDNIHVAHTVIPRELKKLAREAQELVYFRTLRTDIFYEFLFLARPLIKQFVDMRGIAFLALRNYAIDDLLKGHPVRYPEHVSCVCYKGHFTFFKQPVLKETFISSKQEIKGSVAFAGRARGVVKIVRVVADLGKVQEGDVLVTQMTFPSFIIAMKRACAFVTDEGGITCHAAIVAREMEKPCIIGTKIATQVLKDGDMVEVDGQNGTVHII